MSARFISILSVALLLMLALLAAGLSVLTANAAVDTSILPAGRATVWNPGLNAVGGIPNRMTVCATVSPRGSTLDDSAAIQTAIDACPVNQVVQLSAGSFRIATHPIIVDKGITLRGQGPAQTRLMGATGGVVVVVGDGPYYGYGQSINLSAGAVKGNSTVTLVSNPGLAVGEIVLIDQLTDPSITTWGAHCPLGDDCRLWRTRPNRPLTQLMEVASVNGNTVTFVTPFHINFSTSYNAQLTRFSTNIVKYAGIEDLYVRGGTNDNILFSYVAYSWLKGVESDFHIGHSVDLIKAYRSVVTGSYIHSAQESEPGGGAYGIAISEASSDNLVENNIVWNMNKVMVMEASGGGNVIAYNYMEDGQVHSQPGWVETGLNAAHMATGHYELFEGNQSFNMDSDNTWGNAIYITGFRNHLTGARRSIPPVTVTNVDARRAIGVMEGHWWYTLIGNVLGTSNQTASPYSGFVYEWSNSGQNVDNPVPMWRLGWDPENVGTVDSKVLSTLVRGGNFDFFTNTVHWENVSQQALPNSLYLASKPAFFGSYIWPWVDATGTTKVYTLPARARFDAGTPFAGPPGGFSPTPTPTPGDTTPPVISAISATGVTRSDATITWTTNESADGQVVFPIGPCPGVSNCTSPLVSALSLSHSINLGSSLLANTIYSYQVRSRDAIGNMATSGLMAFTTQAIPTPTPTPTPLPTTDTTPPTLSDIAVVNLTASTATINWRTNEPANGQIEFCRTTAHCAHYTPTVTAYTLDHSLNLSGLIASTPYYYWIRSRDIGGNLRVSSRQSFRTTSVAPTPIPTPTPSTTITPTPTPTPTPTSTSTPTPTPSTTITPTPTPTSAPTPIGGGPTDTGLRGPTSSGSPYNDFTNIANAYVSDNVYATIVGNGPKGDFSNFGFTIPAGATINGVEAYVEERQSGCSGVCEMIVKLSWNGGITYTKTDLAYLNSSDTVDVFGGVLDRWGRTWNANDFSNGNFRAQLISNLSTGTIFVDQIRVRVYYTLQISQAFSVTRNLSYGSYGDDVKALQKALVSLSLLSENRITGFLGWITQGAVRRFQAAFGLPSTGYVGPLTRARLQALIGQ